MKVGFTCSTFDLLHAGHVSMLQEAKTQCDYLIVGLQNDPTLDRATKNKPIQSIIERQMQLRGNKYVDDKYGVNADAIHHYVDENGFVVNSDTTGAVSISNRQYEDIANESKRRIKIISKDLVGIILKNFKELL